jgi:CRP-like cAMP-binding protein
MTENESFFKVNCRKQKAFQIMERYKKSYQPEEVICREGEVGDELFILSSGEVEVRKGDTVVSVISEEGAYFGEMSVLLGVPRTATVVARKTTVLFALPNAILKKMMETSPAMASKLAVCESRRLLNTSNLLNDLQKKLQDASAPYLEREQALLYLMKRVYEIVNFPELAGLIKYAEETGLRLGKEAPAVNLEALDEKMKKLLGGDYSAPIKSRSFRRSQITKL